MGGTSPRRLGGWSWWPLAGALAILLLLVAFAAWEGDIPADLGSVPGWASSILPRYGPPAAFVLLYLEESGVPLPIPGDVYVMYVGSRVSGHLTAAVLAWLSFVLAVTLGASNLYLLSHNLGRRLVEGRLGRLLHLSHERLDRAEGWFAKYGIWAIVFGRHVPGLRIPITVAVGVLRVRYRVFAAGVALSAAVWAAFFLFLGAILGDRAQAFLSAHRGSSAVVVAIGIVVVVAILLGPRLATRLRRRPARMTALDDPESGS